MKKNLFTLIFILICSACTLFEPGSKINVAADKRIAGINEPIQFSSLTPGPTPLHWNFEGDKTQQGNKVSYRFARPGTYWVRVSLKPDGRSYKELKIIVTGEVVEEGGLIITEPAEGLPDDAVFDYQIVLSANEISTNEFITISTDAESDFEWDLDDGKKSEEKSLQINYQSSGRKMIKLKRKSTGRVVNTAFITVIEPVVPVSEQDGVTEELAGPSEMPAYKRNFETLAALTEALNKLANAGMESSEKMQIRRLIIEDCLDGNQTPVEGTGQTIDDYLMHLLMEASQYETITVTADWEIDDESNKIRKIIIR
jgi:hypothetical protein